jgi:hypothetical protein
MALATNSQRRACRTSLAWLMRSISCTPARAGTSSSTAVGASGCRPIIDSTESTDISVAGACSSRARSP